MVAFSIYVAFICTLAVFVPLLLASFAAFAVCQPQSRVGVSICFFIPTAAIIAALYSWSVAHSVFRYSSHGPVIGFAVPPAVLGALAGVAATWFALRFIRRRVLHQV